MRRRLLSWRVKLPLILMLFALGPLAVHSYRALSLMEATFEDTTLDALSGLATAKSRAVDQFTDDRTTDVERIAQLVAPAMVTVLAAEAERAKSETPPDEGQKLPKLKDAEEIGPTTPAPAANAPEPPPAEPSPNPLTAERQKAVEDAMERLRRQIGLVLWDQKQFEELLVIDRAGRVVASTFDGHEGKTAAELAYFRNGLGATFVPPVFMSPITERLTMVVATPIRDANVQVIGVLAARLNLTRFFSFINDTTGLGETGETVVARKVDDGVLFMAPTRHDPNAALERKLPVKTEHASAVQEAAQGQSSRGKVIDYRGVCTYAAWRHVQSLGWGLVVKQDCTEATQAVVETREQMILSAFIIGLLALLASIFTAHALVRPLQLLKEATDRISRGDTAISLDIRSGDEIGDLADSFERMIAAIRFFRERSLHEEERYSDEDAEAPPPQSQAPPPTSE